MDKGAQQLFLGFRPAGPAPAFACPKFWVGGFGLGGGGFEPPSGPSVENVASSKLVFFGTPFQQCSIQFFSVCIPERHFSATVTSANWQSENISKYLKVHRGSILGSNNVARNTTDSIAPKIHHQFFETSVQQGKWHARTQRLDTPNSGHKGGTVHWQ